MNNYNNPNGYLLLFRGTDWHKELSPEEIQRIMGDWSTWFDRLGREGKLAAANPLENEGVVISGKARSVADGPFAESKELVGGFYILDVPSLEVAIEWALRAPSGLGFDDVLEIRQLTGEEDLPPELIELVKKAAPTWSATAWR